MRRNLILGLAVLMMSGVVFGVTLINQYSGPATGTGPGESVGNAPAIPLVFTSDELFYSPEDEDISRRYFDGYVEVSSALVPAPFWFQNPHPQPVTVRVLGRSCVSCTSARLAAIPADRVDAFAAEVASGLMLSPQSPAGLPLALAATRLMQSLQWQQLDFEKPAQAATVPPAASDDRPTFGILMFEVKVGAVGPQERAAGIGSQLPDRPMVPQNFKVRLVGTSPFAVDTPVVNLGELREGTGPRTTALTVWSATRDFARFPVPTAVASPADGMVEVGTPVPLTERDCRTLEDQLAAQKQPSPVRSGYRIPVTVKRRAEGGEAELGPFERTVQIAGPNNSLASAKISGTVTGVVTLQGATTVDLKDFNGKMGVSVETFTLLSDRPDVTLSVNGETSPGYLQVRLGEPKPFGPTRRRWQMSVAVPPESCYGDLPRDAAIVLTGVSNGEPFKVRLPVTGRGFRRGS